MKKDRLPRVSAYFRFFGESYDPDEITRRLGVTPTESFRIGDPIPKRSVLRKDDGWIVEIPPRETYELGGIIADLQSLIPVPGSAVKELCQDLKLEAVCEFAVLQPSEKSTPNMDFPPPFIDWLSERGASINVDFIPIS
jgi:hypothetical protein